MGNPFTALKRWARKAYRALKAIEEAVDYRYEDYAQDRFGRLERRIALLEERAIQSGRKPRKAPSAN